MSNSRQFSGHNQTRKQFPAINMKLRNLPIFQLWGIFNLVMENLSVYTKAAEKVGVKHSQGPTHLGPD